MPRHGSTLRRASENCNGRGCSCILLVVVHLPVRCYLRLHLHPPEAGDSLPTHQCSFLCICVRVATWQSLLSKFGCKVTKKKRNVQIKINFYCITYGEISIKATPEVEISGVGLCITVYVRGVNDGENVAVCLCGNPGDVRLLA